MNFSDIPRLFQRNFSTVPPNPPGLISLTPREQSALDKADSKIRYAPLTGLVYAGVGYWFNNQLTGLVSRQLMKRNMAPLPIFAVRGLAVYASFVGGVAGTVGQIQIVRKRLLAALPATSELRRRMLVEHLPFMPFPEAAPEDGTGLANLDKEASTWDQIRAGNRTTTNNDASEGDQ